MHGVGAGDHPADRIVFANWKRLSDASWSYETSASRDFSLQPYSVNDSAVSQYYDPRLLAPGAQATVTIVLGKFSPGDSRWHLHALRQVNLPHPSGKTSPPAGRPPAPLRGCARPGGTPENTSANNIDSTPRRRIDSAFLIQEKNNCSLFNHTVPGPIHLDKEQE